MGRISVLLVVAGAFLVSVAASPQRRFPGFIRTTTACPITLESNPLCGTDNRDYPNMSALRCAQRERLGVQLRHFGRCNLFSQRGNTLQRVPQPGNARFQPQRSRFFQPAPPPPPQQPEQTSFFQPQQPAEVAQPQQQPAEVAQPQQQPAEVVQPQPAPLLQAEQAPAQQPAEEVQPQGVPFFLRIISLFCLSSCLHCWRKSLSWKISYI